MAAGHRTAPSSTVPEHDRVNDAPTSWATWRSRGHLPDQPASPHPLRPWALLRKEKQKAES